VIPMGRTIWAPGRHPVRGAMPIRIGHGTGTPRGRQGLALAASSSYFREFGASRWAERIAIQAYELLRLMASAHHGQRRGAAARG
jgi:hypothetical protein